MDRISGSPGASIPDFPDDLSPEAKPAATHAPAVPEAPAGKAAAELAPAPDTLKGEAAFKTGMIRQGLLETLTHPPQSPLGDLKPLPQGVARSESTPPPPDPPTPPDPDHRLASPAFGKLDPGPVDQGQASLESRPLIPHFGMSMQAGMDLGKLEPGKASADSSPVFINHGMSLQAGMDLGKLDPGRASSESLPIAPHTGMSVLAGMDLGKLDPGRASQESVPLGPGHGMSVIGGMELGKLDPGQSRSTQIDSAMPVEAEAISRTSQEQSDRPGTVRLDLGQVRLDSSRFEINEQGHLVIKDQQLVDAFKALLNRQPR